MKKLRIKHIFIASLLVITAGVGIWFAFPAETPDSNPPSLSIEGGALKGFSKSSLGLYKFEDTEIAAYPSKEAQYKATNAHEVTIKSGVNYYYTTASTTIKKIVDSIDPTAKSILIAYYSPGETGKAKGYHTYPIGPYQGQAIEIKDPETASFTIDSGRGFAIISEKDSKGYGFYNYNEKSSYSSGEPLHETKQGWVLLAANNENLNTVVGDYKDRIESLWIQGTTATEVPLDAIDTTTLTDSYLFWAKLKAKITEGPGEGAKVIDEGDQKQGPPFGPPRNLTAMHIIDTLTDSLGIYLEWGVPEGLEPEDLDYYQIDCKKFEEAYFLPCEQEKSEKDDYSETFPVYGLEENVLYEFKVYGVDYSGQKGEAAYVTGTPIMTEEYKTWKENEEKIASITPPGKVLNIKSENPACGSIKILWTESADTGGATIVDYKIKYWETEGSNKGEKSFFDAVMKEKNKVVKGLMPGEYGYIITGLGDSYYNITISAYNGYFYGTEAGVGGVDSCSASKPNKPEITDLKTDKDSIEIQWEDPNTTEGLVTEYKIQYKKNNATNTQEITVSLNEAKTEQNDYSYILENLEKGNHYSFWVKGCHDESGKCSDWSSMESIILPDMIPISDIKGLQAKMMPSGIISLTWTKPDEAEKITDYDIYFMKIKEGVKSNPFWNSYIKGIKNYTLIPSSGIKDGFYIKKSIEEKDGKMEAQIEASLTSGDEVAFKVIAINEDGEKGGEDFDSYATVIWKLFAQTSGVPSKPIEITKVTEQGYSYDKGFFPWDDDIQTDPDTGYLVWKDGDNGGAPITEYKFELTHYEWNGSGHENPVSSEINSYKPVVINAGEYTGYYIHEIKNYNIDDVYSIKIYAKNLYGLSDPLEVDL